MGSDAPPLDGTAPRIVAGRSCGSCSLCCKVVAVDELAKPIGAWCPHCHRQKGCAIYEQRPPSCRMFICQWMLAAELGPEWKPDRAKFAMLKSAGGRHLTVFADPGNPSAWRRSPYFENLKHWAAQGVRNTVRPAPCRCDDRAALHRDSAGPRSRTRQPWIGRDDPLGLPQYGSRRRDRCVQDQADPRGRLSFGARVRSA